MVVERAIFATQTFLREFRPGDEQSQTQNVLRHLQIIFLVQCEAATNYARKCLLGQRPKLYVGNGQRILDIGIKALIWGAVDVLAQVVLSKTCPAQCSTLAIGHQLSCNRCELSRIRVDLTSSKARSLQPKCSLGNLRQKKEYFLPACRILAILGLGRLRNAEEDPEVRPINFPHKA